MVTMGEIWAKEPVEDLGGGVGTELRFLEFRTGLHQARLQRRYGDSLMNFGFLDGEKFLDNINKSQFIKDELIKCKSTWYIILTAN